MAKLQLSISEIRNNFKLQSENNLTSCSVTYNLRAKQSSSENLEQVYGPFLKWPMENC